MAADRPRTTLRGPVRIGVIIPSTGERETLHACIDSVLAQLGDDYLVLALDRPDIPPDLHDWLHYDSAYRDNVIVITGPTRGQYGHPARNHALHLCPFSCPDRATHVWSLDDDDVALPGALDAIREAAAANPDNWLAFKTRFGPGSHAAGITVWREQRVQLGDIGTPCIVMPVTAKSRWGSLGVDQFGRDYGAGYFGDFTLARDLEAELGPPVWCEETVCEVRPVAIATGDAR